jgi:hypothetical protein
VYNRPLVAIDTSGHIAFLVTAALGALAGAGVSYVGQVVGNIVQDGLTVDAFTNVDPRAIVKGAAVGLVAGATMGVGLTVFGAMGAAMGSGTVVTELIVTGSAGAFSGWSAGRAEHLVNAGYAEYDRWKAGQSVEFRRVWDEAVASGLWDERDMFIDTGTGTFFAWAGMGLASALEKIGVISLADVSSTTTSKPSYVMGFRPDGSVVLETARGPIQLSMAQFEKYLITLQASGVEAAQEFLIQAFEEAVTD